MKVQPQINASIVIRSCAITCAEWTFQCPLMFISSSDPPPPDPLPTPTPDDTGLTVTVPIVECSDMNGPIR